MSQRKVTKLWKTGDGTKVRICDMGDQHLLNAIAMLERFAEAKRREALGAALAFAGTLHGDIATLCIEQEIGQLEESDGEELLPPIFQDLCREASRRDLPFDMAQELEK